MIVTSYRYEIDSPSYPIHYVDGSLATVVHGHRRIEGTFQIVFNSTEEMETFQTWLGAWQGEEFTSSIIEKNSNLLKKAEGLKNEIERLEKEKAKLEEPTEEILDDCQSDTITSLEI